MTLYALAAFRGRHYPPFFVVEPGLSEAEVDLCLEVGEALSRRAATVAEAQGSVVDPTYRGASVGWLYPGEKTRGVFDLLARITESANTFFEFSLLGFAEPVQYTVYEAPSVGYEWHIDMVDTPTEVQRKLSLTLQLSAPGEYDGGALEFRDGCAVTAAPKERGAVIAFPGWVHHRVTPVSRGVRRSLVAWVGGPRFR